MRFGPPSLEMTYLLCRLHALERHVDVLATSLKVYLPEESDHLDDLRAAWLDQCEALHDAYEAGDARVFRAYAAKVAARRARMHRPGR